MWAPQSATDFGGGDYEMFAVTGFSWLRFRLFGLVWIRSYSTLAYVGGE